MSEPTPELNPTSSSDWRRPSQEEVLTLPSGNVARLRRPQIMGMARKGEIPNPLIGPAIEMLEGQKSSDIKGTAEFCFFLVQQAFIEPRVVESDPQEGEIAFDDLSDEDVEFVISWANAPASAAEPFRQNGAGDGGSGDGGEVRLPALAAARD